MKTISYLIIVVAITAFSSCDGWNLNLDSTKPNYSGVGDAAIIRSQLATAYNMMIASNGLFGEAYWGTLGCVDTDEGFRNGVSTNTSILNAHNISLSTNQLIRLWQRTWQGNETATNILSMLKTVPDMEEWEKDEIKGQALVLQAFYHYFAAINWGPVPIKNVATFDMTGSIELERKPVKEVLQFALDNCRQAVSLLPEISTYGTTARISKSAAEALSYRIALYMASHPDIQDIAKYGQIVEWADDFIANGPNKLNTKPLTVNGETLPAYARLFVNNMADNQSWNSNDNPEGIWDVIFNCKSTTSGTYANLGYEAVMRLGRDMGVPCPDDQAGSPIGYADNSYRASNLLFNNYTDFNHGQDYPIGDLRRNWNFPSFCYKYKSNEKMAEGYSAKTRFKYFNVLLPQKITCEEEATVLPIFDKANWNGSDNNAPVIGLYVEQGGSGYTNEKGETTFDITIPATTSALTSMKFYDATKGAIIGYSVGTKQDGKAAGHQQINSKCNKDVLVKFVNGQMTEMQITKSGNIGSFMCPHGVGIGKWRREYEVNVPPIRHKDFTSCNFPILRFADVLLMAAEAHLMASNGNQEKGLEYLNMVRRRAYGREDVTQPDSRIDFTTLTIKTIQDERMRELCFEGVRRADLMRWGLYTIDDPTKNVVDLFVEAHPKHININYPIQTLKNQFTKYQTLPIPLQDIAGAPTTMWQNPGW